MNIQEMTQILQELVDDPEKASVIFNVILESGNPDIIQRTLELYALLILNHGEEIQKALDEEHDREQSYAEIIDRLERELKEHRNAALAQDREHDKRRKKEQIWEEFTKETDWILNKDPNRWSNI